MAPRYRVTLTKEERQYLEDISTKGKRAARTVLYARALLLLDAGENGPKWIVAKVGGGAGNNLAQFGALEKTVCERGAPCSNRAQETSKASTGNSIWRRI